MVDAAGFWQNSCITCFVLPRPHELSHVAPISEESSEASPQTDESLFAKPVRVADAAPLCGRNRLIVAGATVAVP